MVVPHGLVDKFTSIRFMMDRHSSVINQAILCDFITEGDFARHIRRMRELYASRLAVLRESVKEKLKGLLEIPEIKAGLQTVGWLAPGLDADVASRAAADRGVEVIPINRFTLRNRLPEGLLLGFGAVGARELRRGVEGLAYALRSAGRRPKSPRPQTVG
jgi:GntR family transcriptional regulator/MocR family aminotransferase